MSDAIFRRLGGAATDEPKIGSIIVFSHSEPARNMAILNQLKGWNIKGFSVSIFFYASIDAPNPGYHMYKDFDDKNDDSYRKNEAKIWVSQMCLEYSPPLVILEANLGQRAGESQFDDSFFGSLPRTKFILFTSTGSVVTQLTRDITKENFWGAYNCEKVGWLTGALSGREVNTPDVLNKA